MGWMGVATCRRERGRDEQTCRRGKGREIQGVNGEWWEREGGRNRGVSGRWRGMKEDEGTEDEEEEGV